MFLAVDHDCCHVAAPHLSCDGAPGRDQRLRNVVRGERGAVSPTEVDHRVVPGSTALDLNVCHLKLAQLSAVGRSTDSASRRGSVGKVAVVRDKCHWQNRQTDHDRNQ